MFYILMRRSFADAEEQATAFRAQIQLALRYNLPLVLHVRDQGRSWDGGQAEEDCCRILSECNVPSDFPIHRHCDVSKPQYMTSLRVDVKLIKIKLQRS